jgi:hypothetical protein
LATLKPIARSTSPGENVVKYARVTGNLSDLNDEKIVGHVSLDGTFVGLSWISDELLGKPSGGVHPGRTVAKNQRPRYRPKTADMQRPEKSSVKERKIVLLRTATAPQPENALEHSQLFAKSGSDPEAGFTTSKGVQDEGQVPHPEPTVGAPAQTSPTTENELLGRAIGMIRNALEKRSE